MKELLKVLIGIVATVGLVITGLFYLATWMMAGVADEFFTALERQDIVAARSHLTDDFNATADEAALRQFAATAELVTFKEAAWSKRHLASARGQLAGEVITGNGRVPLQLTFVKEHGDWKIYAIQKLTAGLQGEGTAANLPTKPEQVVLVKRAMVDFGEAVNANDMKRFHSVISPSWQRLTSPEKLSEVFANALSKRADFTVLEQFEPVIEPPAGLGEDGTLILKGYFPIEPNQLHFRQLYTYEGLGWKLIGFGFSAQRIEDKPAQTQVRTLL